jgi:hypothetical protein
LPVSTAAYDEYINGSVPAMCDQQPGTHAMSKVRKMNSIPLPTMEVRWFLDGVYAQNATLIDWFETFHPIERRPTVGIPVWKPHKDGKSDVYLLIPGSEDMAIKWREGKLQIKGRTQYFGPHVFGPEYVGNVEGWMKWSYPQAPIPLQRLFDKEKDAGRTVACVKKDRALRKIHLDTMSGRADEVNANLAIDRGVLIELAQLEIAHRHYFSLAFEAFPNDSIMAAAFQEVVTTLLAALPHAGLTVDNSKSYSGFLRDLQ